MSRYTWLLDAGHGGIIDGVYQTAGKRSPAIFLTGLFCMKASSIELLLSKSKSSRDLNFVETRTLR